MRQPAQSNSDAVRLFAHHLPAVFHQRGRACISCRRIWPRALRPLLIQRASLARSACWFSFIPLPGRASASPAGRFCGKLLCTVRGEWHLAWLVPTNGIGNSLTHVNWLGNGYPAYLLTAFAMPALYGSWRFILFSYLAGPFASKLTTSNINEWPAVWCLFSIGLVLNHHKDAAPASSLHRNALLAADRLFAAPQSGGARIE